MASIGMASTGMPSTAQRARSSSRKPSQQQGYILLTLLLFMALLVIAAAAIAPSIAFEIRRDQDEELVHRGVQYSRAIRNFAKKTGRFPNRLEELRETNGLRFIRKLYKDPITGKDFKPLHMMDIPVPGQAANLNQPNSQADANSTGDNSGSDPANPAGPDNPVPDNPAPGNPAPSLNPGLTGGVSATNSKPGFTNNATTNSNGQPGLLIFGVVSTSKAKSIREFDHKKHYNEWLFFYDPRYDSGREIKGPTSLTISAVPQAPPSGPEQIPATQVFGTQGPGTSNAPSAPPQPQQ